MFNAAVNMNKQISMLQLKSKKVSKKAVEKERERETKQ